MLSRTTQGCGLGVVFQQPASGFVVGRKPKERPTAPSFLKRRGWLADVRSPNISHQPTRTRIPKRGGKVTIDRTPEHAMKKTRSTRDIWIGTLIFALMGAKTTANPKTGRPSQISTARTQPAGRTSRTLGKAYLPS